MSATATATATTGLTEPFIHLAGVTKVYRSGRKEHLAISDATFDVMPGELVALVGPSGCGKSTLLKVLAGLHGHDQGTVRIGIRELIRSTQPRTSAWSSSRRCCSSGAASSTTCCCRPNCSACRWLQRASGAAACWRWWDCRATRTSIRTSFPAACSSARRSRARSIHDPKLVLMDEPFGALDALTREKMNLELLRIWKESGKTIVFVTHGISEAVFLGSRVVVFTAGPARMADNFEIELPHPRTLDMKTQEAFGVYTRRIYKLLGME